MSAAKISCSASNLTLYAAEGNAEVAVLSVLPSLPSENNRSRRSNLQVAWCCQTKGALIK